MTKQHLITFIFLIPNLLLIKCSAQERIPTTQDLHNAQDDLTLGHRFSETMLYRNRNVISSYIETVTSQLLDSFMDSYNEIHHVME
jgi:hypothetical protein